MVMHAATFRLSALAGLLGAALVAGGGEGRPAQAQQAPAQITVPVTAPGIISPGEAMRRETAGEATLIDVRTPQERAQGYPAGSVAIPWGGDGDSFAAAVLARFAGNKAAPVMLICHSGNRSARAASALAKQGFTQVQDVSEGFSGGPRGPGWQPRGLPVQTP